jgi:lipopolysaccharide export system protein LptA
MRWQKVTRIALAFAGLTAAAVIYFYAKDRPTTAPVTAPAPKDPNATFESGQGSTLRMSGDAKRIRYSFESQKSYTDRDVLTKAHAVFEADGLEFWADEVVIRKIADGQALREEFTGNGNVRVRTDDGLDLRTDSAEYDPRDGGTLLMPGPVTFSKNRVSGSGNGASYVRSQELFKLNENANVVLQPDEAGAGGIRARSRSMTMARIEHFARLEQGAVIERTTETLSADTATIYLTEDEKQIRLVDLKGRARVVPVAGTSGPPDMKGDTISLTVHPEGNAIQRSTVTGNAAMTLIDANGSRSITAAWIDATTAPDGRTLTGLAARERVVVDLPAAAKAPARRVEANTLTSTGEAKKGLTLARFEGTAQTPVRFTERHAAGGARPGTREGTSRRLDLKLGGSIEAIDEAEFRERVRFTDGTTVGVSERAVYKATTERLELHTAEGRVPHVERTDLTVDGQTIAMEIAADRLDANGNVRTLSKPSSRDKSRRSGLFDDQQDIIGSAARVQYDGGKSTATYTGASGSPASLIQGTSRVTAQQIDVDDNNGNLRARGSVDSTMEIEDKPADPSKPDAPAARMPHRITSDELVYEDAARKAVYTGTPNSLAKLSRPDGSTEAVQIDVTLAAEGRTLKELRASGSVYAKIEPDSEAIGHLLIYDAVSELYTLHGQTGQLAVAKVPDEERKGCWRSTGPVIRFKRTGPQPASDQRTRSETMDCKTSIKSMK